MKTVAFIKFVPGIAWFFVVLILLCLPGSDIPGATWLDKIYFDKWVHTGIFGLLALLFMLPLAIAPVDKGTKFKYILVIAIAVSAWGLTTEFIQKYLVSGRNFDLLDWAADSLGSLVAFIYCRKKHVK